MTYTPDIIDMARRLLAAMAERTSLAKAEKSFDDVAHELANRTGLRFDAVADLLMVALPDRQNVHVPVGDGEEVRIHRKGAFGIMLQRRPVRTEPDAEQVAQAISSIPALTAADVEAARRLAATILLETPGWHASSRRLVRRAAELTGLDLGAARTLMDKAIARDEVVAVEHEGAHYSVKRSGWTTLTVRQTVRTRSGAWIVLAPPADVQEARAAETETWQSAAGLIASTRRGCHGGAGRNAA